MGKALQPNAETFKFFFVHVAMATDFFKKSFFLAGFNFEGSH